MPKGRSNALLDAEIKELRSEIAESRAVFRARPMTDEEVADPSTIPANASFDFGDVDVDLEGLSEDDLKAWTSGISTLRPSHRCDEPAARRMSSSMNDAREDSGDFSLERQRHTGATPTETKGATTPQPSQPRLFRREAWLEAGARGLDVRGYQPTDLDRQALADRREVWDRAYVRANEVEVRSASDRDERADKFDYDKGVLGRLIEVSSSTLPQRADAETSTYVAIELNNGRRHQMWGVGLEQATKDSGAKPGDRIYVRRDGVERVTKETKAIDAATGLAGIERRQVPRNRWRVTAETFRATDQATAAQDPDLVAAQSQIVIIEKLKRNGVSLNRFGIERSRYRGVGGEVA
jgi:hypothetical protein